MKIHIKKITDFTIKDYEEIYNNLNNYQKHKISKLKNEVDKKLSLIGLKIIVEQLCCQYNDIHYCKGKPYVKDNHLSISHKNPYTVVVISDYDIGIDIEKKVAISSNLKKYLFENDDYKAIKKFTFIESNIKCFNKRIYNLDLEKGNYIIIENNDYIITICRKKY